jgi:hypothetical protein
VQKVLHNLMIVSNRVFPSSIKYTLLEDDYAYDTPIATQLTDDQKDNSYIEYIKQRHEFINPADVYVKSGVSGTVLVSLKTKGMTADESNRLVGGWLITKTNQIYIIGNSIPDTTNNTIFYNELQDENGIIVNGALPANTEFTVVTFGIIKQNAEYIEDHLYVEVGQATDKSRIRDKAIKIKITYEGYDYVTVQTVLSYFIYSFN